MQILKVNFHTPFEAMSYDPKRLGINLIVWLLTIKFRETRIKWLPIETCDMDWKDLVKGYNVLVWSFLTRSHMKELWAHKVLGLPLGTHEHFNHFKVALLPITKYIIGRRGWHPFKLRLCEYNKFKASVWPKIGSIYNNHLHAPLFWIWINRKHALKFSFFVLSFRCCHTIKKLGPVPLHNSTQI